jgi:hypothetical protein
MNQTDYGLAPFLIAALAAGGARYANTYLYAKYLNTRCEHLSLRKIPEYSV